MLVILDTVYHRVLNSMVLSLYDIFMFSFGFPDAFDMTSSKLSSNSSNSLLLHYPCSLIIFFISRNLDLKQAAGYNFWQYLNTFAIFSIPSLFLFI